jgi:hypothetical protein
VHRRLLVPALLVPLLLTGCSTGTDADDGNDVATPPSASPSAATSAAPTAEPSPTPTAQVIEVTYSGGQVTGVESRVEVPLGEQVLLRITSDVAEEIHVHGYDIYIDVPAGGTAEQTFTADLPGAYEVELHDAGRPLFQLRVA